MDTHRAGVDKKIFWVSLVLVGAIAIPLLVAPELGLAMMDAALAFLAGQFGWL